MVSASAVVIAVRGGATEPAQGEAHSGSAASIAAAIIEGSKGCFGKFAADESSYASCTSEFCQEQCGVANADCQRLCSRQAQPLFAFFRQSEPNVASRAAERAAMIQEAATEQREAMNELQEAQERMRRLNRKMAARASDDLKRGDAVAGHAETAKVQELNSLMAQIDQHLEKVGTFQNMMGRQQESVSFDSAPVPSFLQRRSGIIHMS
eukprot:TRINITY_DN1441_c0_g1_i1.p1 TRINITY_DN1441_c0_g1~~TRINITY_DN1441_c0_g1_i1.p1  ORF type:complete len:234 (+),score=54.82 TRINITY_DN1441_c0_g1_i1:78-704(+)